MKILHICLGAFYIDNYSYQENMLPKYHKKLGYDVVILASLQTFDKNGNATYLHGGSKYINEYGINVTRLDYKNIFKPIVRKLKIYKEVYKNIEREKPDIIFIHNCQFVSINEIIKYLRKNPNTKVFIDNHCDFSNSATNWVSKNILHKIIWKYYANKIEPYTQKFYGVLPARVDFLIDMYKLPKEKVELLVMGADDERVEESKNKFYNKGIRSKYNIKEDDFLIVTGGKIDSAKKQTLFLMEAVKNIKDPKVKLLIFGAIAEELKNEFESLCDGNKIQYIGWIESNESYNYFAISDLVIFPGRHSVFWEQVVGQGIPIVVKYWKGTTHIDLGGNCKFLYKDSVDEIESIITEISNNKLIYNKMKSVAKDRGEEKFSYKKIAQRSIRFE